jgi:hypothetical protein
VHFQTREENKKETEKKRERKQEKRALTVKNLSEDNVLSVQPWGGNSGDEELRRLSVGTSVGHRHVA